MGWWKWDGMLCDDVVVWFGELENDALWITENFSVFQKKDIIPYSKIPQRTSPHYKVASMRLYSKLVQSGIPYSGALQRTTPHYTNYHSVLQSNGFQAKCLRSILPIPPPCISRISHGTLLQRTDCKHLSAILKFSLLSLFHSIANLPDGDFCRRCNFRLSRVVLQGLSVPRRQGRPKQMCASEVYGMAEEMRSQLTCKVIYSVMPVTGARKFSPFVFARLVTPLAFPAHVSPCTRRMNLPFKLTRACDKDACWAEKCILQYFIGQCQSGEHGRKDIRLDLILVMVCHLFWISDLRMISWYSQGLSRR